MATSLPQPGLFFVRSAPADNQAYQMNGMRSHVRRRNVVVMQHERVERGDNFSILTNVDMANASKERSHSKPKNRFVRKTEVNRRSSAPYNKSSSLLQSASSSNIQDESSTERKHPSTFPAKSSLAILSPAHPYTSYISGSVQLHEDVVDMLLKNRAFQIVSEPLFCTMHVDNDTNIVAVFPGCFENTAFAYALLYSIMHELKDPQRLRTTSMLKGLAIRNLRQDLDSLDEAALDNIIGTVLILSGTAYRSENKTEHETHSGAIEALMSRASSRSRYLRDATKRVVFWQDLIGAACVGSPRRFSLLDFPDVPLNPRVMPFLKDKLPIGFTIHKEELIEKLQNCIMDIVSFQKLYEHRDPGASHFALLDRWQASIESRLIDITIPCINFGIVSESCRVAAYICCYSIYTEVWSSSFIPMKLTEKLLKYLSQRMTDPIWNSRRDLFLWCVFVCTCTIQGTDASYQNIREQHETLLKDLLVGFDSLKIDESVLDKALGTFMYVGDWIQRRLLNKQWLDLEGRIRDDAQLSWSSAGSQDIADFGITTREATNQEHITSRHKIKIQDLISPQVVPRFLGKGVSPFFSALGRIRKFMTS